MIFKVRESFLTNIVNVSNRLNEVEKSFRVLCMFWRYFFEFVKKDRFQNINVGAVDIHGMTM
jgi:hypothetical protein